MTDTTYDIVRTHLKKSEPARLVRTGLTLREARAHCKDPETSSVTCTSPEACAYTEAHGDWFDRYRKTPR